MAVQRLCDTEAIQNPASDTELMLAMHPDRKHPPEHNKSRLELFSDIEGA